jgi:hypothetical protein
MDEASKKQFKWIFYRLAVQLNAIILLVALSVMAFFIFPGPYRSPAIAVMLLIAIILAWNFAGKYRETKAWLEEHSGKGKVE